MIHAYEQLYLDKAKANLGRMLDYAVNELNIDIQDFYKHFLTSGLCKAFENGDCSVIVGRSGVENVWILYSGQNSKILNIKPRYSISKSPEYWTGWALAHFQWHSNLSFTEINHFIDIKEVLSLYTPYHEMDIRQFLDYMYDKYFLLKPETNLKIYRTKIGLSQKDLSKITGIPVRTIQQYEQRQKNINKAQAEYLLAFSKALCCRMEDLLEVSRETA